MNTTELEQLAATVAARYDAESCGLKMEDQFVIFTFHKGQNTTKVRVFGTSDHIEEQIAWTLK
ncbi:MAG: hypothetical protein NUV51_03855 [Sulfuricaulis sp.]|nr:hypothetical protein [Sulfuricaulis sp.]